MKQTKSIQTQYWSVIALLLIILVIMLWAAHYKYVKTPAYTIYQLGKAIDKHDVNSVKTYANIDSLAINMQLTIEKYERYKEVVHVENMTDQQKNRHIASIPELTGNQLSLHNQQISLLKSALIECVKHSTPVYNNNPFTTYISDIQHQVMPKKDSKILIFTNEKGETAQAGINLHLKENDKDYAIVLRLTRQNDRWVVTSWSNYYDFLRHHRFPLPDEK